MTRHFAIIGKGREEGEEVQVVDVQAPTASQALSRSGMSCFDVLGVVDLAVTAGRLPFGVSPPRVMVLAVGAAVLPIPPAAGTVKAP